jgi:hypothetical protein
VWNLSLKNKKQKKKVIGEDTVKKNERNGHGNKREEKETWEK